MILLDFFQKPIVLASQSPRRAELLRLLNIEFTICASDYAENGQKDLRPPELALIHALGKAQAVAPCFANAWIIGADTIVVRRNCIYGKPANRQDALRMLRDLSGKAHIVYTAYCILNASNGKYLQNVVATVVRFRPLDAATIEYYVDNFPPYDKAGAYGIQDFSAIFVDRIEGCFYNVVGFPLPAFYHQVAKELSHIL